jgi:hypothetical protein
MFNTTNSMLQTWGGAVWVSGGVTDARTIHAFGLLRSISDNMGEVYVEDPQRLYNRCR